MRWIIARSFGWLQIHTAPDSRSCLLRNATPKHFEFRFNSLNRNVFVKRKPNFAGRMCNPLVILLNRFSRRKGPYRVFYRENPAVPGKKAGTNIRLQLSAPNGQICPVCAPAGYACSEVTSGKTTCPDMTLHSGASVRYGWTFLRVHRERAQKGGRR